MMKDHAEEAQSNLQQFIEITKDFLALRRGELEFWRTNDKLRRRGDFKCWYLILGKCKKW